MTSISDYSPKLFNLLRKKLHSPNKTKSNNKLNRINKAYLLGIRYGSHQEPYIIRNCNVNKNPRPARIIQILFDEYQNTRESDLVKVIKLCCSSRSNNRLSLKFNYKNLKEEALSLNELHILGSLLLDEIRHIHISIYSTKKREEILDVFQNAYVNTLRWKVSNSLDLKIENSLKQQLRINGIC